MSDRSKWADLQPRVLSATVIVAAGLGVIWLGGVAFHAFVALVVGLMTWELVGMLDPERHRSPLILGGAAALALFAASYLPPAWAMPLVLAPSMMGVARLREGGVTFATVTALMLLAGIGMIAIRDTYGFGWMMWLVVTVVVVDVAGYFAGRMIGGPKFWPRVSPKKTWSGTIAGWIGAAFLALGFVLNTEAGFGLISLSVAVAMASQLGDIAESALKRRAGVKDSSQLIPGHGGVFDRFDGMLGAALFMLIAGQIVGFPPGVPPVTEAVPQIAEEI